MTHMKRTNSLPVLLISLLLPILLAGVTPSRGGEKVPSRSVLPEEIPYVKQAKNYCGPAALASTLRYWGIDADQKTVGKAVFDSSIQATNGADMMLYARDKGFVAYSWNSSLDDLKEKLALGIPVIVLQDSSITDRSGHYRVATGYDDAASVFYVNDPYEPDMKEIPYETFEKLWRRHGHWSLLICPANRDIFKQELDERNPVVHIDLAYIYYRRGDMEASERESRVALALEPHNFSAQSLLSKVTIGARSKADKKQTSDQN